MGYFPQSAKISAKIADNWKECCSNYERMRNLRQDILIDWRLGQAFDSCAEGER